MPAQTFTHKNSPQIAYCTNVHAGQDWETAFNNLRQFTGPVRQSLIQSGAWEPDEPMGVGLWLAEPAANVALQSGRIAELKDWLESQKLVPFTMNGFPQGNFHQPVVKHRVYQPPWWEDRRRIYTESLISILDQLLPENVCGSISTLPIAWGKPNPSADQLRQAADNLGQIANQLEQLFEKTGRSIVLAIEPEPGCYLTDNATIRTFFREYLLNDDETSEKHRKYLTVCHDVCHAAVMREDQANEFSKHQSEGIRIGKVQVSSAIDIDWDSISDENKLNAFMQLQSFAEDRYLHQTTTFQGNGPLTLHEDLPELLGWISNPTAITGNWRVHFHVPIFYDSCIVEDVVPQSHASIQKNLPNGSQTIGTTQREILRCIDLLESKMREDVIDHRGTSNTQAGLIPGFLSNFFTGHYEVETYAWTVLPEHLRHKKSLVEDIAREMSYFKSLL